MDTQFENATYSPKEGVPYQQLHFLPAKPASLVIDDSITEHSGVFQITLRYPAGRGVKDALARAESYAKVFYAGAKFDEVYIIAPCSVNILGVDGDRYGVVVSIYFKTYEE
nr:MAG TPA: tail completion protein [Caudoviricetes sp.]